jgi:hypothetical protein
MDNALNSKLTDRVFPGQLVSRDALGESASNLSDLILGQFRLWAVSASAVFPVLSKLRSKLPDGVKHVLTLRNQFQIFDPIVILDPVTMVDHQMRRDRSDKRLIDKPMNFERFDALGSSAKGQDIVTVFVYTAADKLAATANDAAVIRDLIAVPFGNVSPFFDLFHTGEDTTGFSHMARARCN